MSFLFHCACFGVVCCKYHSRNIIFLMHFKHSGVWSFLLLFLFLSGWKKGKLFPSSTERNMLVSHRFVSGLFIAWHYQSIQRLKGSPFTDSKANSKLLDWVSLHVHVCACSRPGSVGSCSPLCNSFWIIDVGKKTYPLAFLSTALRLSFFISFSGNQKWSCNKNLKGNQERLHGLGMTG